MQIHQNIINFLTNAEDLLIEKTAINISLLKPLYNSLFSAPSSNDGATSPGVDSAAIFSVGAWLAGGAADEPSSELETQRCL